MSDQTQEQFAEYVAARSGALLRTAYALTGNQHDAEDLVQAGLAKAYTSWHRIQRREAVDAYVRRIMVNTHIGWWRRRRLVEWTSDRLPDHAAAVDAHAEHDAHDAVWAEIQRLPARQRAVVVLRYYEDLADGEIADVLGISTGTVRSTSHRALAKLRDVPALAEHAALAGSAPTTTTCLGATT